MGTIGGIIALCAIFVLAAMWAHARNAKAERLVRAWLTKREYRIVSLEGRDACPGSFSLPSSRHQVFLWFRVEDKHGHQFEGFARVGSFFGFGGMSEQSVEVIWS